MGKLKEDLAWHAEYPAQSATIYLSGVSSPDYLRACEEEPSLGLLTQPRSVVEANGALERVMFYAADNGCFASGDSFDPGRWLEWLSTLPTANCLFAVLPDVLMDPRATLRRSLPHVKAVKDLGFPTAFVAQDGQEEHPVPWDELDCLFIGGSTHWKLSEHAVRLGREARQRGKWSHVGRVNSWKRLHWCMWEGFDSADGTFLRWGPNVNLPHVLRWMHKLQTTEYPVNQEWRIGGYEVS